MPPLFGEELLPIIATMATEQTSFLLRQSFPMGIVEGTNLITERRMDRKRKARVPERRKQLSDRQLGIARPIPPFFIVVLIQRNRRPLAPEAPRAVVFTAKDRNTASFHTDVQDDSFGF